jgi:prepilin-type N-terminal cleavage/methylation domain-containing protein
MHAHFDQQSLTRGARRRDRHGAFTLIELLVVLAIIGTLVTLSMPAFKGFGQSNTLAAAERQLIDDLGLARQYAIKNRATVYMVFLATNALPQGANASASRVTFGQLYDQVRNLNSKLSERAYTKTLYALTNAFASVYSGYAIYAESSLGEQPGNLKRRYLTEWRTLPDGVVFPPEMAGYLPAGQFVTAQYPGQLDRLPLAKVPFPFVDRFDDLKAEIPEVWLPYVAWDATGQLRPHPDRGLVDQYLSIGLGSVMHPRQPLANSKSPGPYDLTRDIDAIETPRDNHTNSIYRIAALTGRAKLYKPEVK